ncbi:hypothetical protein BJ085DRAFT_27695 [Dimargaris cristalligena]|uniref:ARID domain-containing protein n=1 Tax=Dimargaris cristalligena TaxID=215637 RepID=A0A4P9ZKV7_9FUNG|nr:hypothetical protein BJ085DRAFT_27695 [Dimargaris cristalligena]|eukprot:RKP33101.1 hypothetical protein BJ085DRAFT_27695 [Dimargaris cristalligena]
MDWPFGDNAFDTNSLLDLSATDDSQPPPATSGAPARTAPTTSGPADLQRLPHPSAAPLGMAHHPMANMSQTNMSQTNMARPLSAHPMSTPGPIGPPPVSAPASMHGQPMQFPPSAGRPAPIPLVNPTAPGPPRPFPMNMATLQMLAANGQLTPQMHAQFMQQMANAQRMYGNQPGVMHQMAPPGNFGPGMNQPGGPYPGMSVNPMMNHLNNPMLKGPPKAGNQGHPHLGHPRPGGNPYPPHMGGLTMGPPGGLPVNLPRSTTPTQNPNFRQSPMSSPATHMAGGGGGALQSPPIPASKLPGTGWNPAASVDSPTLRGMGSPLSQTPGIAKSTTPGKSAAKPSLKGGPMDGTDSMAHQPKETPPKTPGPGKQGSESRASEEPVATPRKLTYNPMVAGKTTLKKIEQLQAGLTFPEDCINPGMLRRLLDMSYAEFSAFCTEFLKDFVVKNPERRNVKEFKNPQLDNTDVDLQKLFWFVIGSGGFLEVAKQKLWKAIGLEMRVSQNNPAAPLLRRWYDDFLLPLEEAFVYPRDGDAIAEMEANSRGDPRTSTE